VWTSGAVGGCSGGWRSNFGNEYCYDDEEESQEEAREICHRRDSELASISSDAECDYIAGLMSAHFPHNTL